MTGTLRRTAVFLASTGLVLAGVAAADAQMAPPGPPAVGVIEAVKRPVTESNEFLGRIEAPNRVNVVARVTAFLEKRNFVEGAEVKTGDLLYQLERGPFEADLASKKAQVAQLQATLVNAKLTLDRAKALLAGPAGQQSNVDSATANQESLEAQVQAAKAQVDLSQINLDYTEIHSPIDGKIGRTAVTEGNVVTPSSGTLTTIVSQDPMYVTFPVSVREALALRARYAAHGGFKAVVIRVQLPDGRLYDQVGELNFVNNTIAQNTDTISLRGTIPNPSMYRSPATGSAVRELTDNEFVTVLLEGVKPVEVLAIPRSAVLSDQAGEYVYVVGADNKAEQKRIKLGQSTSTIAAVTTGLSLGDKVIVEGLQKVRAGQAVAPGPASALIQSSMKASAEAGGAADGGSKPAGTNP
ncbi:efflux RND transporter periplasmic adaptor subunit [Bradyrhizobium jicamae]|uniref:Efflux RND transporter periplasmic adaptor subunit n=2 Tax=Bradyrhizobium jicamae TaxID=280332 RepID=A0ABS5FBD3_9BRAD|nr:efflux RND transporter periplasmic adaptor subunit [Bradyrhizobium jicamae]MBR0794019.1 efflux RND transporter periplasmic adaptor subunit [Bradyrhizobium jicamae]MBR0932161.1 efflux RND transporter periplasmic adaptor subunit [Bradyrhizobium jicamae]